MLARLRDRRDQSGFGLLEVIVTVLLAGLVVLGLATGLLLLVRTTRSNEQRQLVQQSLGNYAESVKALDYLDCDGAGSGILDDYRAAYDAGIANWQPERPGMQAQFVRIDYWDADSRQFVSSCAGADQGAQRLTIEVTWQDRTGRSQVVIGDR